MEATYYQDCVGVGRFELPSLSTYASETYAYTSSATRPQSRTITCFLWAYYDEMTRI